MTVNDTGIASRAATSRIAVSRGLPLPTARILHGSCTDHEALARCSQAPAKGQDSGDVCLTRRNHARVLIDDILKSQRQFCVFTKPAKCFRNRVVWIQDR